MKNKEIYNEKKMTKISDILTTTSQSRHMTHDKCSVHTGMGAKMRAMLNVVCGVFQSFFKSQGDMGPASPTSLRKKDLYVSSAISDYTNTSNPGSIDKASTAHVPNNNFGSSIKTDKANRLKNNGEVLKNERISRNKNYNKMQVYNIVSVSQLETMPGKDAAGVKKMHRKIVCETNDNQSFAFHLWGNLAKVFMGKVGDTIICDYKSKVHVSRAGIVHENLTMENYAIVHRAAQCDDLELEHPSNASEPDCEIGVRGVDYPDFDDETIDYDYAVGTNNKECNYGER